MPRMYCSHVAYCITLKCSNSHHQSSPRDPGSQRWGYVQTLFLDVPTFTTRRLPRDPSSQRWNYVGEKWPMNFVWNDRLPRSIQESFTCRKSTTCDRRLYLPSEGRRAEDFFALKNPTASAVFEPANLDTKSQHATSRPLKPLTYAFIPCLVSDNEQSKFKFWSLISKFGFGGFPVAYWDARWRATLCLWFDILYCSPHTLFTGKCRSYCVWLSIITGMEPEPGIVRLYVRGFWFILRSIETVDDPFDYCRYFCMVNIINMVVLTAACCHLLVHGFHCSRFCAHRIWGGDIFICWCYELMRNDVWESCSDLIRQWRG